MTPIRCHILWPGGNTTGLIEADIEVTRRHALAQELIRLRPDVEQVGFVYAPNNPEADVHLEMTGGEFCGNATRCAAFFWAQKTGKTHLLVEASGMHELVDAQVTDRDCSILLPPQMVQGIRDLPEGTMVDLEGISHLIIDGPTLPEKDIYRILQPHMHLPAVGAIFTSFHGHSAVLDPYVHFVQGETPVLIRETGCASGSIAVGVVLHRKHKADEFYDVTQPTGEKYRVKFMHESIAVRGPVEHRETLEIEL